MLFDSKTDLSNNKDKKSPERKPSHTKTRAGIIALIVLAMAIAAIVGTSVMPSSEKLTPPDENMSFAMIKRTDFKEAIPWHTVKFQYDDSGTPISCVNSYKTANNAASQDYTTTYVYSSDNQSLSRTESKSNDASFGSATESVSDEQHDDMGRVSQRTYQLATGSRVVSYEYDDDSHCTKISIETSFDEEKNQKTIQTYDKNGRTTSLEVKGVKTGDNWNPDYSYKSSYDYLDSAALNALLQEHSEHDIVIDNLVKMISEDVGENISSNNLGYLRVSQVENSNPDAKPIEEHFFCLYDNDGNLLRIYSGTELNKGKLTLESEFAYAKIPLSPANAWAKTWDTRPQL